MEKCDINLKDFVDGKHQLQGLPNWPKIIRKEMIEYVIKDLMDHILNGLMFIHSQKEVHRDLSPPNSTSCHVMI